VKKKVNLFEESELPYVGGNEQRDTRAETIAFLKHLIQANDNDAGEEELQNYQNSIASSKLADCAIHP
jgi:hypothetical protein